jgi:FkbM family methyltransferase
MNTMSVTVEGHTFQVVPRIEGRNFSGFWPRMGTEWEPGTLSIIRKLVGPGRIFLDVGAWIGPTAIWAALHGADVHAFEPDPIALATLQANIDANESLKPKVTVIPAAAGTHDGQVELFTDVAGNSETSCFRAVQRGDKLRTFPTRITVPQVDLLGYLQTLMAPPGSIILKMDIEGGEFALLPHVHDFCRQQGVVVLASLHPLNIVLSTEDDTGAARITGVAAALDRYRDFHWYGHRDDAFIRLRKVSVLETIMNALAQEHRLLLSPSPLAGAR